MASPVPAPMAQQPATQPGSKWGVGRVLEMLGEFGAGYQGRPSPVGERKKLAMAQQEQQSQSALRNMQMLESKLKIAEFINDNVPEDKHEAAKAFLKQMDLGPTVIPGSDGRDIPVPALDMDFLIGRPDRNQEVRAAIAENKHIPEHQRRLLDAQLRKAKTPDDVDKAIKQSREYAKEGKESFDQESRLMFSVAADAYTRENKRPPTVADMQRALRAGLPPDDLAQRLESLGRLTADEKGLESLGIMATPAEIIAAKEAAAIPAKVAGAQAMLPVDIAKAQSLSDIELARQKELKRLDLEQSKELKRFEAGLTKEKPATLSDITTLKGRFDSASADFRRVHDSYAEIIATGTGKIGDISLLYKYAKMLDRTGAVREGDIALLMASSVPDFVKHRIMEVQSGKKLTDAERAEFLEEAGNTFRQHLESHTRLESQYVEMAKRHGIAPRDVVSDYVLPDMRKSKGRLPKNPATHIAPGR